MGKSINRYAIEGRLSFIEFRLYWEGHVNRSDIVEKFDVSVVQASNDLNRYLELAPGNMAYDGSGRTYRPTQSFIPIYFKPDGARYLAQIRSVGEGITQTDDTFLGWMPDIALAVAPARSIEPDRLRTIVGLLQQCQSAEILYQSLSRPEPMWRRFAPHSLAWDGFRWHVRGFCFIDGVFKDFVIARVLDIRNHLPVDDQPALASADADWQQLFSLKIAPHPGLTAAQRKGIELDYGMVNGVAELRTRKALLYYTLKRLGLDTNASARSPADQQIVLAEPPAPLTATLNQE
ncbi:conserved hypothetical protein [Aromatoleum aromaticum EbN1]|uniref:WYL domain-containing protein n=1 Tax=Aromatoleum aromaticum (strain DSM 19018 / LMG 30748 / EbN1) TaxID=76114 RepID=Q5P8V4_AROAE|nr:transcriptional regulator [Aromatoleum aromaticum]CAI06255.1 conserved hypothetical protein [Aromatoleum aromaticum EbN1]